MKRFKHDYLMYYIGAVLAIALGVLLIVPSPVRSKGLEWVNYIVGALLLVYVLVFLAPMMTKKRRAVVKGFMIAELVLVCLMALGMFLTQIPLHVTASQALGVCLYARGFVEIVRGYYNLGDQKIAGKQSAYDHAAKYINIALITLGTWVFFCGAQYVNSNAILICVAIILLVCGAVLLYLGTNHLSDERKNAPKKVKEEPKQETIETEEVPDEIDEPQNKKNKKNKKPRN